MLPNQAQECQAVWTPAGTTDSTRTSGTGEHRFRHQVTDVGSWLRCCSDNHRCDPKPGAGVLEGFIQVHVCPRRYITGQQRAETAPHRNGTLPEDSGPAGREMHTAKSRRVSRTWRDRLLGAGAGAAFTLVILWLVLVSTAVAAVILRA